MNCCYHAGQAIFRSRGRLCCRRSLGQHTIPHASCETKQPVKMRGIEAVVSKLFGSERRGLLFWVAGVWRMICAAVQVLQKGNSANARLAMSTDKISDPVSQPTAAAHTSHFSSSLFAPAKLPKRSTSSTEKPASSHESARVTKTPSHEQAHGSGINTFTQHSPVSSQLFLCFQKANPL